MRPENHLENMFTALARFDGQHMLSERNDMCFSLQSRLSVRVSAVCVAHLRYD